MRTNQSSLDGLDNDQAEMMEEICLLVDLEDNVTGTLSKFDCHYGRGKRHRAFSVLLFDEKGRLLVQQRASEKITFPDVWANSCCSHPLDIEGENGDAISGAINAAKRKLEHELGIPISETDKWSFHHLGKMEYSCRWDSDWIEREVDHILIVKSDTTISPNSNEISNFLWAEPAELAQMMEGVGSWEGEVVAPWFRLIWENLVLPIGCDPDDLLKASFEEVKLCGEVNMDGTPKDPSRKLFDSIAENKDRVEEEIMHNLGKMKEERLHSAMTHLLKGGGKRLRAIIPILVGNAVGTPNQGHYTLGASIEIIHNFTLIHDDIMDQDPIRRGLQAVHVIYDNETAICAGDAMLAVGFEMLGDSEHIPSDLLRPIIIAIGSMVRKVASGQQKDISFEKRDDVSEDEYLDMISEKTSAMFEACAKTGALLADSNTETVENMGKWGLNLGLCFQLIDDLIDITGDTKTIGKPAGSDISQGKMTLIAIHALQSGHDLSNFHQAFGNHDCSDEILNLAVEELVGSGSIEYARNMAMKHHSIAHDCLSKLPESKSLEILRELTDFQLVRIS